MIFQTNNGKQTRTIFKSLWGLLLVLTLPHACNVYADNLYANKLPNYLAYGNLHPEYWSDGDFASSFRRVNSNMFVYITTEKQTGYRYRLYSYDIERQQSTLLYQKTEEKLPFWRRFTEIQVKSGKAYVSMLGKLILTDGTDSGTELLKDFGSYYSGGTLGYNYSNIHLEGAVWRGDTLYFIVEERFGEYSYRDTTIWRADGNRLSRISPLTSNEAVTNIFSIYQDRLGPLYYLTVSYKDSSYEPVYKLWHKSGEDPPALIRSLPSDYDYRSINATNRLGSYFHSVPINGKSIQPQLWRLSNAGSAEVIADCDTFCHILPSNSSGVYFLDAEGFWYSNGFLGNKTMVYPNKNEGIYSRSDLMICQPAGDSVYLIASKNKIIKVDNQTQATDLSQALLQAPKQDDLQFESCSQDHITFSYSTRFATGGDRRYFIFDAVADSLREIKTGGAALARQSEAIDISADKKIDLSKMPLLIEWRGIPIYLSSLNLSFLPSIYTLLDE